VAGFGAFTFGADEEPVADTGWLTPRVTADITLPLGAARESIVYTNVLYGGFGTNGSAKRTLEFYLTKAQQAALEALVNTVDVFTDWESTPVGMTALLLSCECLDAITGWYSTASQRRRVRIELLEQWA
jgi:hypothetical protein